MQSKALFSDPKNVVAIRGKKLPHPNANKVLIKTAYSYISAGTELTMLQYGPINYKAKGPRKVQQIGYSLAGTVLKTGKNITHVKPGDAVSCIGEGAYHATHALVAKNLVAKIPAGVSLKEAAPVAMMCFALEGLRKARLEIGENVLIIGGGLMGQFLSQMATPWADKLYLVDKNSARLAKAAPGVIALEAVEGAWKRIADETAPVGIETVFFCLGGDVSAIFDRVKTVMHKAPDGILHGKVCFPGGAVLTVNLASPAGNLQFLSSAKAGMGYRDSNYENGRNDPLGYVPWTVARNMRFLLNALAQKRIDSASLISHEFAFKNAMQAYNKLIEPNTNAMAVVLKYE